MIQREIKKGSAELLILALVEPQPKHGYELCKLIESRSRGVLRFHVASLYPLLYRLEDRGLIEGRWVEKAGQRRRRFYRITAEGKRVLASHRRINRNAADDRSRADRHVCERNGDHDDTEQCEECLKPLQHLPLPDEPNQIYYRL